MASPFAIVVHPPEKALQRVLGQIEAKSETSLREEHREETRREVVPEKRREDEEALTDSEKALGRATGRLEPFTQDEELTSVEAALKRALGR